MPVKQITKDAAPAETNGKHLVVNCRTGDVFAADTIEEATSLASDHQKETDALLKKAAAHGNS